MSGSDRVRILVSRIVEMYELLQALNVTVVKESLLEVRTGGFGGRTLFWCQRHVARGNHLHLALPSNSLKPAISSAVSLYLPARKASNFDEKALTCTDCSYESMDWAQWS